MPRLLIVNKKDKIIGTETKEKCHEGKGILHRAFSILIFNKKNQILLSRRSQFKKLWPLVWDNTCSSHPLKGERYEEAGQKRLKKEFGFTCPLTLIDKFQYQALYKNLGSENEVCALLVGKYDKKKIKPNPKEIADWKWMALSDLQRDIKKNSQKYTPWLKIGLEKYLRKKISLASTELSRMSNENSDKEKLDSILVKLTKIIDLAMKKILISEVDQKFKKIVSYQTSTGGKRLRPALAIICCRMLGGKFKDVLYPAVSLELLHNYTLIVDDIIDKSTLRRGKPTTWFKFGNSIAQCVGVNYSASIFQAANKSRNSVSVSALLAKTLKTVIEGEILDILFEQSGKTEEPYVVKNRYQKITKKDYFDMIGKKTAALFQACCELGGIAASVKKKKIEALKIYGFNFGMVFQIQDDILDIFGEKKLFGKKIGKDIEERKGGNIVILFTLEELNFKGKKRFLKILRKKEMTKKDFKEAMKFIKKTNSYQKASLLGKHFAEKAKKSLKYLPQNKWNEILRILADFTIERNK